MVSSNIKQMLEQYIQISYDLLLPNTYLSPHISLPSSNTMITVAVETVLLNKLRICQYENTIMCVHM
jgi:hypothetical protein